jgi:hypothetical protein
MQLGFREGSPPSTAGISTTTGASSIAKPPKY